MLATALWAQGPQFGTRVNEVMVPVSVMTKSGRPVENLTAEDFLVLNDGKPQVVRMSVSEGSGVLPIYAVIVVQTDEGSEPALAKIRKTASVISSYITNDMETGRPSLAAVITVADEVRIAQDFTADPDRLKDTFVKMSARGDASRVLDGISLACDLLAHRKETARRVVVLISESRDSQSKTHFAPVIVKAQKEDVVIYTISYSPLTTAFTEKASDRPDASEPGLYDPNDKGGINLLAIPMLLAQLAKVNVSQAFAEATGGGHAKFTTLRGLEKQLTAIGSEIHNRYMLTFVPQENEAPGYHKLSVSLRTPEKGYVHARAGYWMESK